MDGDVTGTYECSHQVARSDRKEGPPMIRGQEQARVSNNWVKPSQKLIGSKVPMRQVEIVV